MDSAAGTDDPAGPPITARVGGDAGRLATRPPAFLGATALALSARCQRVTIDVRTATGGCAGGSEVELAGTALVTVDAGDDLVTERRRRAVATYRWVLGQLVDPSSITLLVDIEEEAPLTAFLTHCRDPEPGAVIARAPAGRGPTGSAGAGSPSRDQGGEPS